MHKDLIAKLEVAIMHDPGALEWRNLFMKAIMDLGISVSVMAGVLDVREGAIHSWLHLKNVPGADARGNVLDILATIAEHRGTI